MGAPVWGDTDRGSTTEPAVKVYSPTRGLIELSVLLLTGGPNIRRQPAPARNHLNFGVPLRLSRVQKPDLGFGVFPASLVLEDRGVDDVSTLVESETK